MFDWIPDAAFTWYWALWIVVGFGIPEVVAIVRKQRGDTFSEKTWRWFSLHGSKGNLTKWGAVRRFAFLSFWAWLTMHFITGGSFL